MNLSRLWWRTIATAACSLLLIHGALHAQEEEEGSDIVGQTVDSRKGYIIRIPSEARLDSAQSGWSPQGRFEVRLYKMPYAGDVRVVATVKPHEIPENAINNGSYTYVDADSATSKGTAKVRTYYLPTRSVRIELIPNTLRMFRYIEESETIFGTFRWKPGAMGERIDTEE